MQKGSMVNMIVKITFLNTKFEEETMLFGNSYKAWYDQVQEYLYMQIKWESFAENIVRQISLINVVRVETSPSAWLSWGGLKWCTESEFQNQLNREGKQTDEPDCTKPRLYAQMKFNASPHFLRKTKRMLEERLRCYDGLMLCTNKTQVDNYLSTVKWVQTKGSTSPNPFQVVLSFPTAEGIFTWLFDNWFYSTFNEIPSLVIKTLKNPLADDTPCQPYSYHTKEEFLAIPEENPGNFYELRSSNTFLLRHDIKKNILKFCGLNVFNTFNSKLSMYLEWVIQDPVEYDNNVNMQKLYILHMFMPRFYKPAWTDQEKAMWKAVIPTVFNMKDKDLIQSIKTDLGIDLEQFV
jgi:hypothetical protein